MAVSVPYALRQTDKGIVQIWSSPVQRVAWSISMHIHEYTDHADFPLQSRCHPLLNPLW